MLNPAVIPAVPSCERVMMSMSLISTGRPVLGSMTGGSMTLTQSSTKRSSSKTVKIVCSNPSFTPIDV